MHAKNRVEELSVVSQLKKSVIKLKNKLYNDLKASIFSTNTTKIDLRV